MYFDEHIYFFKYEGIIRRMILNYKFNDKAFLYKTFVNFLLKNENLFEILQSYDTIVPVPISNKRLKQRGYNQSLLIAKEINKYLKVNLNYKSLVKNVHVIQQSKLNKEDRLKNIQGVYKLNNKEILESGNILLIDDIYTTGSTVNECSRVLKSANVNKVGVLTIAKD